MSEITDCVSFIVRKVFWSLRVAGIFLGKRTLDFLGLLFFVLACLTLIRLPCMVRQVPHLTLRSWRYIGFLQFLIFILDVPVILMFIIMTVFSCGLMMIPLYKEIKSRPTKYHCDYCYRNSYGIYFGGFELRCLVVGNFCRFVVDVLLIPATCCLALSWRLPKLIKIFKTIEFKKWDLRERIVTQFLRLIGDILTLPFLVLVICSWRCPVLVVYTLGKGNFYQHSSTICQIERQVIAQAFLLPLDILQLISLAFLLCTWRSVIVVLHILKILRPSKPSNEVNTQETSTNENTSNARNQKSTREKFRDKYKWFQASDCQIKKFTFRQLGNFFIDLPFFFLFIILLLLPLRLPSLIHRWKKLPKKTSAEVRKLIAAEFFMLLICILMSFCFFCCILAFWRLIILLKQIKKSCASFDSNFLNWHYKEEFKLYKTVALNFLMIFVDLFAFVLLFILFITVIKVPKIAVQFKSGSKQAFSVFIIIQFAHLCVDVVFGLIFLLLMVLRPVTAWVVLLEDTKHKNNRILVHYMQWVPDVISDLQKFRKESTDYVCMAVKCEELAVDPWKIREFQKFLNQMCYRSCKRLRWLREKTKSNEEFCYRLELLQHAHKQVPLQLCAQLVTELEFLKNRDTYLRKKNVAALLKESSGFEETLVRVVSDVKSFPVPKVPLYEEQCGLMLRTRKETQKVLLEALPKGGIPIIMVAILEIIMLCRAPLLFRNLKRQPYAWREVILNCAFEYLKDLFALLELLLLVITIVYLPNVVSDIYFALFIQRSWKAARKCIGRYPPVLIKRIGEAISCLFSFRSVRFVAACVLMIVLGPADVILTTTAFILPEGCNCIRYLISALFHISLSSVPFLIHFNFNDFLPGWAMSLTILSYMFTVIFTVFMFLIVIFFKSEDKSAFKAPVPGIVVWSWSNVSFIIHDFIDLAQDLALLLVTGAKSLQYGSYLQNISDILLFNFLPYYSKFIVYPLVFTWCFFFVTPTVLENILDSSPVGTTALNPFWRFVVFTLSKTLFLSISEFLVSTVACVENGNHTYGNETWVLAENDDIVCWQGYQRWTGSFSLYLFFYYFTTTILFTAQCFKFRTCNNIQYSPLYELFLNFIKVALVLSVVYSSFYQNVVSTNTILCVIVCVAVGITCLFKLVFGFHVSAYPIGLFWKVSSLIFLLLVSCLLIASEGSVDVEENFSFILVSLLFTLLFVNVIASFKLRKQTEMEKCRHKFVAEILHLERSKVNESRMTLSWNSKSDKWKRLVKSCRLSGMETYALPPPYSEQATALPAGSAENSPKNTPPTVMALDRHDKTAEWYGGDKPDFIESTDDAISGTALDSPTDNPNNECSTSQGNTRKPKPIMYADFIEKKFSTHSESGGRRYRPSFQRRGKPRFPFKLLTGISNSVECIGSNLLLAFEANVRYESYSVEGLNAVVDWRERVPKSNWPDLVDRLEELKGFLEGTYEQPRRKSLIKESGDDATDSPLSFFTYNASDFQSEDTPPRPLLTLAEKESVSEECMTQLSDFVSNIVTRETQRSLLLQTLRNVLPSGSKDVFISSIDFTASKFRIEFDQKKVTGTVQKVGERGIPAAVGAKVVFAKYLTWKVQEYDDGSVLIRFVAEKERPTVQKFMLALTVQEIKLFYKQDKQDWYFGASGQSKKANAVIETLEHIKWS